MQQIELLVSLKIPDVTALTAAGALRRRMGYADALKKLQRADYYRFEVDAGSDEEAQRLVTELAEKTNLFVNPNKHVFHVRTGGHTAAAAGEDARLVHVLVTDPNNWSPGYGKTLAPHGAAGPVFKGGDFVNAAAEGLSSQSIGAKGGNVGKTDGSVEWRDIAQMRVYRGSLKWEDAGCTAAW